MQMLPNLIVINPCDYNQTRAATIAVAEVKGPVYLRFGRPKWPIFFPADQTFEIGKAWKIQEGIDVTIFSTGHLVVKSIEAAKILEEKGHSVELINIHTIKPLDEEAVLTSVQKTRCAVAAEEHQITGGMGSKIAQLLTRNNPAPLEFVGVNDSFGESGTAEQLLTKYGMSTQHIVDAALKVIGMRG